MNLLNYLRQFHNISQADYELLTAQFHPKRYKKGEIIVNVGQIQREVLFVNQGVQMSFFEGNSKQHVIAFTYPPNLSAIPESFMFQAPSKYTLQCLTDSEFNYVTYEALQELFDRSQPLERLFRRIAEAILAGLINRHMEAHSLTMAERFRVFSQRSPHIFKLVPHKYIASYLDIDPTNFSKLFNSIKI